MVPVSLLLFTIPRLPFLVRAHLRSTELTRNSDGVGGKPWVDASTYLAPGAFYQHVDDWLPTWGEGNDRGMTVKTVKMWQEGACGSPTP